MDPSQGNAPQLLGIDELKKDIEKILSTVEIMKTAKQEGEITDRECEVAIAAWQDTGKELPKSSDRVPKFKKLLGQNFGPKRSSEIYELLMRRTKAAKDIAAEKTNEMRVKMHNFRAQQKRAEEIRGNAPDSTQTPQPNLIPGQSYTAPPLNNFQNMSNNGAYSTPNGSYPIQQHQSAIPMSVQIPQPHSNYNMHQGNANLQPQQYQQVPPRPFPQANVQQGMVNSQDIHASGYTSYPSQQPFAGQYGQGSARPSFPPLDTSLPTSQQYHTNYTPTNAMNNSHPQPSLPMQGNMPNHAMSINPSPRSLNMKDGHPNASPFSVTHQQYPQTNQPIPIINRAPSPSVDSDSDKKRKKPPVAEIIDPKKPRHDIPTTGIAIPNRPDFALPNPGSSGTLSQLTGPNLSNIPKLSQNNSHPNLPVLNQMRPPIVTSLASEGIDLIPKAGDNELEETLSVVKRVDSEAEVEFAKQVIREKVLITREPSSTLNLSSQSHEDFVLNFDAVATCIADVLANSGMKIHEAAVHQIMETMQAHIKDILESAVAVNKKRLNKMGISNYIGLVKLGEALKNSDHGGDPSALFTQFENKIAGYVGMKWGPDVKKALALEEIKRNEYLSEQKLRQEEKLLNEIKQYKIRQSTFLATKKKNSQDSTTLDDAKWLHEEFYEKRGELSWSDIIRAHVRQDAAHKNDVQVPSLKKPFNPDEEQQLNDSQYNEIYPPFVGHPTEAELAKPLRQCPLFTDEGIEMTNELKSEDIALSIARYAVPRTGGPYSASLGNSLRRFNAGLKL